MNEMLRSVLTSAAPMLLDSAVKATVILAMAAVAVRLMRRQSAAARQLVWVLAMVATLVVPALSQVLPGWRVLPDWASLRPAGQAKSITAGEAVAVSTGRPMAQPSAPAGRDVRQDALGTGLDDPGALPAAEQDPGDASPAARPQAAIVAPAPAAAPAVAPAAAAPLAAESSPAFLPPWLTAIWLAGVVIVLLPLAISAIGLLRLARGSQRVADEAWLGLVRRAAGLLRLEQPVVLLRNRREPMPMLWGAVRAKVLLPAAADSWPADRKCVVLLHELAHAKRHDCAAKLLAHVACAAYWFNPLAWWALRQMQAESETACDDLVLAAGHRPSDYATHLLDIASGIKSSGVLACGSIAMARRSRLQGRVRAILDDGRNRRSLTRLGLLVAAILVAALVVPLASMKAAAEASATKPATQASTRPAELAGQWAGEAGIVVAWCKQKKLPVSLTISADGSVSGTVGDATLRDAAVYSGRGAVEKALNFGRDFIVRGRLDGPIVAAEGIARDAVSIPFDLTDGKIHGGVATSGSKFGGKGSMILSAGGMVLTRSDTATQPAKPATAQARRTITGRVVDEAGKPVAGVNVSDDTQHDSTGTQAEPWTGKTNADGRFQWTRAPAGDVALSADKSGYMNLFWIEVPFDSQDCQIVLRKPIRTYGTVVDAQTGAPIKAFQLIGGMADADDRDHAVHWSRSEAKAFNDGRYDLTNDYDYYHHSQHIRIEAAGYAPAESGPLPGGPSKLDFKLVKAQPIVGHVKMADGKAVQGVPVYLAFGGLGVDNGAVFGQSVPTTTTDADGKFKFDIVDKDYCVLAIDKRGYAQADKGALDKGQALAFQPWAKIQGVAHIGDKPFANGDVSLDMAQSDTSAKPHIMWRTEAKTNAQGQFGMDRVPAGPASFRVGLDRTFPAVTIEPGQALKVTLGGDGRAVKGKIVPVAGQTITEGSLSSKTDWTSPAIPIPADVQSGNPEERQRWLNQWVDTTEGRQWSKQRQIDHMKKRTYRFKVSPDGSFAIEDVLPGKYQLRARFKDSDPGMGCDITVQTADGKPQDLGALEVKSILHATIGTTQPATAPASAPATQAATSKAEIDRLIIQLGSEKSAERNDARKALVTIGLPALPALQAATTDNDAARASRAKAAHREISTKNSRISLFLVAAPEDINKKHSVTDLVLADQPLVIESDIVSYDPKDRVFELTDEAQRRLSLLRAKYPGLGSPFVVVVDDIRWYEGAFWTHMTDMAASVTPKEPITFIDGFGTGDKRIRITTPQVTAQTDLAIRKRLDVLKARPTTAPASAPATQATPTPSTAPVGDGVLGMVRASSTPTSAPTSLPSDAVELGKRAFEILGKDGKGMTNLLAKGLTYASLPVDIAATNRASLQLRDAYIDGDEALLIGTPLIYGALHADPVVLHLHASRTTAGWSVAAWQGSDPHDVKILDTFLQQHPSAKHAFEAPALTAPKGGRMFAIKVIEADTDKPLEDAAISIVVMPADKAPAFGALSAWASGAAGRGYSLITDAAGTTGLPLGERPERLQLFVHHRGHVALRYETRGDIPNDLTLSMQPGLTIGGVVQDEDGKPIANASVNAYPASQEPESAVQIARFNRAVTDKQGHWSLDGMPTETRNVFVVLDHPDYVYDREWHNAGPMDGLLAETNVMVLKQTNITVSGVVHGPDGKPLAGATVAQGKNKWGTRYPRFTTKDDGKFVFKQTPAGDLLLYVTAEGCAPDMVTIDAQENAPPVDFHLAKSKPLRGRLVDQSGNPVVGVPVEVDTWRDRESLDWKTRTDAAGRFEYKDAPADAVKLRIGEGRNADVVEVEPSDDEQVLTLTGGDTGF